MEQLIQRISSWVWNPGLVLLCIICGVVFTIFTRFVQVRRFVDMHRMVFRAEDSKGGISAIRSFCLAVAGRVGTGNIVGVATAIGYGGPGSVVWMWILAFFCAGTAFVESTLAQIYKENINGQHRGGASFYIEKGLGSKVLAVVMSLLSMIGLGYFLIMLQSNSISTACVESVDVNPYIVGAILTLVVGFVIVGGMKRISSWALALTPVMTIIYLLLAVVVLAVNYEVIPSVLSDMISSAFGTHQIFGGIFGSAVAWGARRGLFSNEAGLGTFATISGATESSHPVKVGLVQSYSVFIDTFLVCTATAIMVLATKTYNVVNFTTGDVLYTSPVASLGEPDVSYTIAACQSILGEALGGIVLTAVLITFAFTTIIACYYYAENEVAYLCKKFSLMKWEKTFVWVMRSIVLVCVFLGCISNSKSAWSICDIFLGLIIWLNLIALLTQCPKVFRTLKDYDRQEKAGVKDPMFDPKALGITDADFWE